MEDNKELMTLEENEIEEEIVNTDETEEACEVGIAQLAGLVFAGAALGICACKATKPIRDKAKSKIKSLFKKKKKDDNPIMVDCEVWDGSSEEDTQNNK